MRHRLLAMMRLSLCYVLRLLHSKQLVRCSDDRLPGQFSAYVNRSRRKGENAKSIYSSCQKRPFPQVLNGKPGPITTNNMIMS
jgi:hypothetical protein